MVGVSMLFLLLTVGPTSYAFGLFVLPVSSDLGLSRADMNTGLIVLNFGMAALAPFVGRMIDRVSIRLTIGFSAALFVAGFFVLAFSHNVWLSAAMLAGPIAMGVLGLGTLSTTALVTRWFAAQRARALAIATIGISLGSVIAVPLIGLLIEALGWRQALMIEGFVIAVLVGLVLPFVHEKPSGGGAAVASEAATAVPETPLTTGRLLRSLPFWVISVSLGLGFGVLQTIVVSLAPYAQEHDLPMVQAASLISVYGGMAIAGKVVLAWIGDRIDRVLLLTVLFGVVALTAATPLISHTYWALVLCAASLGTAAGATTPAFSALLADRFGAASIGTSYGLASTIVAIISAACIRFGGETYDRSGSYDLMFVSCAAIAAIAAVLMAATTPIIRLQAARSSKAEAAPS
jgi:MFS family permease